MIIKIKQLHSEKFSSITVLNQLITSLFPKRNSKHSLYRRRYFDTFDWRLYKAGYLLEEDTGEDGHTLKLRSMGDNAFIMKETCTEPPRFYSDLPSGRLQDTLKPLLNERALLPQSQLNVDSNQFEIYNDNDKTVLRIVSEGVSAYKQTRQKRAITAYLELHPLRGYRKEMAEVQKLLTTKFDFNFCHTSQALVLFEALGKSPAGYSSKLDIELELDMPSHAALSSALIYNLDIMEQNEPGILEDIDIEFLHDFRVAGRRSRSVLGQVHGVFPKSQLKRYKKSFSWLNKLTSSHRDLDVFLCDFNEYYKQVSLNGEGELEPLRYLLKQRRLQEHKRLVKALSTKRYDRFKTGWRNFLEQGQKKALDADKGTIPIIEVANQSIWHNYKKVLRQGNIINTRYTFDSIHRLRKNAKKLRYLIDTFRSLYPDNDLQSVRKCLRRLQDNLGEITDMHAQRHLLDNWKTALAGNKKIPQITILAIDELEHHCASKEKSAKRKFKRRYREFSSKENRQLFQDIFTPSAKWKYW